MLSTSDLPNAKVREKNTTPKPLNLPDDLIHLYKYPEQNKLLPFNDNFQWGLFRFLKGLFIPFYGWFGILGRNHLVQEDEYGLINNHGKSEVLRPGWHVIYDPWVSVTRVVKQSDLVIKHGTLKIITVPEGQMVLIRDKGEYQLLVHGDKPHIINSANVEIIDENVNLDNPVTKVGNSKIIRVNANKAALVYRQGKNRENVKGNKTEADNNTGDAKDAKTNDGASNGRLEVLGPGIYYISPPDEFDERTGIIDTTLQTLELGPRTLTTKDNFQIYTDKVEVFYEIIDPQIAYSKFGSTEGLIKNIADNASSTFGDIVKNNDFEKIGQNSKVAYGADSKSGPQHIETASTESTGTLSVSLSSSAEPNPSAPPMPQGSYTHGSVVNTKSYHTFVDDIHDTFLHHFNEYTKTLGIQITNIRMEPPRYADQKAANELSAQAMENQKIKMRQQVLQAETEFKKQVAQRDLELTQLESEKGVKIAENEKKATVLKAQGEAEAAKLLAAQPGAMELRVLEKYVEAMKNNTTVIHSSESHPGMGAFLTALGTSSRDCFFNKTKEGKGDLQSSSVQVSQPPLLPAPGRNPAQPSTS